jgi:hypothetical protein
MLDLGIEIACGLVERVTGPQQAFDTLLVL